MDPANEARGTNTINLNTGNDTAQIEDPKKPLTMVDLSPLCLDTILLNLGLKDLTNVAETSVHLAESAARVFRIRFKHDNIQYGKSSFDFGNEYGNEDERWFLKTLKHFGPLITSLSISFKSDEIDQKILDLVVKQCSSTLTQLTVGDAGPLISSHSFPAVRKLRFNTNCINSLTHINKRFPELRCLEIYDSFQRYNSAKSKHATDQWLIGHGHIPNLRKLEFENMLSIRRHFLRMAELINANPQITDLTISFTDTNSSLQDFQSLVNWDLLNVTKLSIQLAFINIQFVAKLPKLNSLSIQNYPQGNWSPVRLNIEELIIIPVFTNDVVGKCIDQLVNFIISCPKVKYFTIKMCDLFGFHDFERMATNLQELIEVNFECSYVLLFEVERKLDAMLEFICRCKNLRLFKVKLRYSIKDFKKHQQVMESHKKFERDIERMSKVKKWIVTSESKIGKHWTGHYMYSKHEFMLAVDTIQ